MKSRPGKPILLSTDLGQGTHQYRVDSFVGTEETRDTLRVTSTQGAYNANFFLFVPVPVSQPVLHIARAAGDVVLSWEGVDFILESADKLGGTWSSVPAQTNPFTVKSPTGTRFYRLRR